MIPGRLQTRTSEDIEVRALSGRERRVIDRRIARNNALCLVGFINKKHGHYEVMEFLDPVERTVFPSLGGAITPGETRRNTPRGGQSAAKLAQGISNLPLWQHRLGKAACTFFTYQR